MNDIPGERVRMQLEKISTSGRFANSHKLTHFLRLVVEESLAGRGDQIKEYSVGVEVYNRPEGYDPRVDATVRVEATKLRKRLREYYAGEGRNDPVLITIPKGHYAPVFEYQATGKPARRQQIPWRLLLAAGSSLLVLVIVWWWVYARRSFRLGEQRRISTFPGSHTGASFSPDGSMVAFVSKTDGGAAEVWVKNLSHGDPLPVTKDGETDASRPRWSPQNDQIVFERKGQGIWSVPPLGGPARRIIEQGGGPDLFPDGGQIVFVKGQEIWIARADGSGQQSVRGLPKSGWSTTTPAVSPDGRWIAFFRREAGPKGDLWVIPASGGQARQLTFDVQDGGEPVWTRDGRWILFPSARSGSLTLWRVAFGGGTPEPVTIGAGEDMSPAISPDGKRLIFTNARHSWVLTLLDPVSGVRQELLSQPEDIAMPVFSPEGDRIAYFQHLSGEVHLFVMGADGKEQRQVTRDRGHLNIMPEWSQDGASLYFYQFRPVPSFRKVAISGAASVEIAPWAWDKQNHARVDSGGHSAVYTVGGVSGPRATFVRDLGTGQEKPLAEAIARPQWSRDGKSILGSTKDDRILACPVAGGACKVLTRGNRLRWSGDGSRIFFFRTTRSANSFELWSAAGDGSDEKKIAQLGPFRPTEVHFDVSSRGEIVWVRFEEGRQELWLAEIR